MNRALLFRRRLTMAGMCILSLLLITFYFALRSAAQSEEMNRWVAHTQEVLAVIAQVRLDRARLENELWEYRQTHDPVLRLQFQKDRNDLREAMKRLRELTVDNPEQQQLLSKLVPYFWAYVTSLEEALQQSAEARKSGEVTAASRVESSSAVIRQYFEELENNERTLLRTRSEGVRFGIRRTRIVLLIAGVLSFTILLAAGHLIQREIMMRERVEDGLRDVQQLLQEKAAALAASREELRKQYAILRSVLDSMAEGVVVADQDGHFTLFNPAAEHILGAGPADIPPAEWPRYYQVYQQDQTTLFPSEDQPLVRALRGETADNVHLYVRNGQHAKLSCLNVSGRPLLDPDGTISGGVAVFHDITEILEANRELEAFSYSVSHDLRAPLRHMDGFSRILEKEFASKLPAEAEHYIGRIRKAATHMSTLVEDMLQLSRIGRQLLRQEVVPLGALIEEVRADVMQEAPGREVKWRVGALPEVSADAALLRQVLVNLLSNAVKFTRRAPHAVIEIGSREENGEAVIFVRDNGAGFDPRYADKLFGVFQRLHRQDEFEGTGIGLAIVQRIIHKHRGRVWAESQPHRGATFYFSLPARARSKMSAREMVSVNP